MRLRTIKRLRSLGIKISCVWLALSALFIYTSIDMVIKGEIPHGFLKSQLIIANMVFFIAGVGFFFAWQYWIKSTLRKNGLDGLLNR